MHNQAALAIHCWSDNCELCRPRTRSPDERGQKVLSAKIVNLTNKINKYILNQNMKF
jgi:hypothetical protein